MTRVQLRNSLVLAAIGALLAACAGGPEDGRPMLAVDGNQFDMQDPIEAGRAYLASGQNGLAIDRLTQSVQDDPGNIRALTLLAVAYGRIGRYDLSDRYNAAALAIDPSSVTALNNLGYSYLVRGDRTRAIGLLERAAAIDASRPIVAANLADAIGKTAVDPAPRQPLAAIARDVPLSKHVTLVRRTGRLVRLAPGVQMLLTTSQEPEQTTTPLGPLAPPQLQVTEPVQPSPVSPPDPIIAQFRRLFAIQEGHQLAEIDVIVQPSPFGFFPSVDDFTL